MQATPGKTIHPRRKRNAGGRSPLFGSRTRNEGQAVRSRIDETGDCAASGVQDH